MDRRQFIQGAAVLGAGAIAKMPLFGADARPAYRSVGPVAFEGPYDFWCQASLNVRDDMNLFWIEGHPREISFGKLKLQIPQMIWSSSLTPLRILSKSHYIQAVESDWMMSMGKVRDRKMLWARRNKGRFELFPSDGNLHKEPDGEPVWTSWEHVAQVL